MEVTGIFYVTTQAFRTGTARARAVPVLDITMNTPFM